MRQIINDKRAETKQLPLRLKNHLTPNALECTHRETTSRASLLPPPPLDLPGVPARRGRGRRRGGAARRGLLEGGTPRLLLLLLLRLRVGLAPGGAELLAQVGGHGIRWRHFSLCWCVFLDWGAVIRLLWVVWIDFAAKSSVGVEGGWFLIEGCGGGMDGVSLLPLT